MRLAAAICAGVFAYLAVGYATGYSPAPRRRRPSHPGRPTRAEWLAQAGARVSPGQFWATSLCAGGATFLVVAVLTGAPAVALGPGVAVGAWPRAYYHRRRQQVGTERIAAWPDALRTVAAGLAARQTLHEALAGLATAGPPALRPVFERYRRLASSLDQRAALEAIRAELADPTSDRVIKVLIVAAEEGPAIVLDILNRQARDATLDVEVDEQARSAQLEQRLNAWGVAVLPYVLLVLMCLTWPEVRSFYRSAAGAVVVAVGLGLSAGGVALVGRLGRRQSEERVFVTAGTT